MKPKYVLTVLAVAIATIAQPALAEFTQNKNGEITHVNGIPLPPMQTVEEARAQAQKEIAVANKAREAVQAENNQSTNRNTSLAAPPQEIFYTGKPYIEETSQYAFLFRSYDPELSRWTTADPSGFPDGANNLVYCPTPTHELDLWGLKSVSVTGIPTGSSSGTNLSIVIHEGGAHQVSSNIQARLLINWEISTELSGWIVQKVQFNYSDIFNDDGTAFVIPNPPTPLYWEAWRVDNGVVQFGGFDLFETPAFPESTYGMVQITGKVDFYHDSVISSNDPSNWGSGSISQAGDLLATTTQPEWWTGSGFNHELKMTWE